MRNVHCFYSTVKNHSSNTKDSPQRSCHTSIFLNCAQIFIVICNYYFVICDGCFNVPDVDP